MLWYETLDAKIRDYLPDLNVVCDEPMSRHTSFHVGGPAKRMAFPDSGKQLVLLMSFAEECGARPLVIGNGTNLLAPDQGLDRLVINTSAGMKSISRLGTVLRADCGVSLAQLADFARREGLTGLEFAHGIPGSLGGGVCMNAGAYDGEMKDVVTEVTVLDPARGVRTCSADEMEFRYRRSLLTDHPDWVVLHAAVCLKPGDPAEIKSRMDELMQRRKKSQPLEYPSAGSTFQRPAGYFAGPLIEGCGLKGYTVGGAQVSEKHAGFVINRGGATCADILSVIRHVQDVVYAAHGVRLEPEVRIIQ